MMNHIETFAKRVEVTNIVYKRLANKELSDNEKEIIASILNDFSRLVNEGFAVDSTEECQFAGRNKKLLLNLVTVFCGIFYATYMKSSEMSDFLEKCVADLGDFHNDYINKLIKYDDNVAVNELKSKYEEKQVIREQELECKDLTCPNCGSHNFTCNKDVSDPWIRCNDCGCYVREGKK